MRRKIARFNAVLRLVYIYIIYLNIIISRNAKKVFGKNPTDFSKLLKSPEFLLEKR